MDAPLRLGRRMLGADYRPAPRLVGPSAQPTGPTVYVPRRFVAALAAGRPGEGTAFVLVVRAAAGTPLPPKAGDARPGGAPPAAEGVTVQHRVAYAQRWGAASPLADVAAEVRELLARPLQRAHGAGLVLDATGLASAAADLFAGPTWPCRTVPVRFVAGALPHEAPDGWRLPEREPIAVLGAMLARGGMTLDRGVEHAEAIEEQLAACRVAVTDSGREHYETAGGCDLLTALGLACWYSERVSPARPEWRPDPLFSVSCREARELEAERQRRVPTDRRRGYRPRIEGI